MPSVAVVCIKTGTKYSVEYVNRLAAMVRRHVSRSVPFVCITDDASGIEAGINIMPVRYPDLHGWWQKTALFGGYDFSDRRILYLDLDTVLVGSIDPLLDYAGPFAILRDFWGPAYNSSVMALAPGVGAHVWTRFTPDVMTRLHGDQDWITAQMPGADLWQTVAPGLIGSLKADGLEAGPRGFSVICLHGRPKQTDLPPGHWARVAWEGPAREAAA